MRFFLNASRCDLLIIIINDCALSLYHIYLKFSMLIFLIRQISCYKIRQNTTFPIFQQSNQQHLCCPLFRSASCLAKAFGAPLACGPFRDKGCFKRGFALFCDFSYFWSLKSTYLNKKNYIYFFVYLFIIPQKIITKNLRG